MTQVLSIQETPLYRLRLSPDHSAMRGGGSQKEAGGDSDGEAPHVEAKLREQGSALTFYTVQV